MRCRLPQIKCWVVATAAAATAADDDSNSLPENDIHSEVLPLHVHKKNGIKEDTFFVLYVFFVLHAQVLKNVIIYYYIF